MLSPMSKEYACVNLPATTIGSSQTLLNSSKHPADWPESHQTKYITIRLTQVQFRFQSAGSNTRTFPGTDIDGDHDLVFLNFKVSLTNTNKLKNRLKFDLDRMKDHSNVVSFQVAIYVDFDPLIAIHRDSDAKTASFNEVMTEAANDITGTPTMGHTADSRNV